MSGFRLRWWRLFERHFDFLLLFAGTKTIKIKQWGEMGSQQPVRWLLAAVILPSSSLNCTELKATENIVSGYIGHSDRITRNCCPKPSMQSYLMERFIRGGSKTLAHKVWTHANSNQGQAYDIQSLKTGLPRWLCHRYSYLYHKYMWTCSRGTAYVKEDRWERVTS